MKLSGGSAISSKKKDENRDAITEDPIARIKAMVKDLYLTPGPNGGQLYSMNQIISVVNRKEPIYGRMVDAERILDWAFERTTNTERPTWNELLTLGAKLELKPADKLEDRTWEETIYQKVLTMETLHTNEQMVIRGEAINQINRTIEIARATGIPIFVDTNEALKALEVSNAGLLSSFNPMTMRTVVSSTGGKRNRR